jgi:hypothetical protein
MGEDALDVARFAVAATRLWREQMQRDWGDYREPEEILDAAVGELLAERDRLRAVVDAVRSLFAEPVEPGEWAAADLGTEPYNRLLAALAALDGSADMGGES